MEMKFEEIFNEDREYMQQAGILSERAAKQKEEDLRQPIELRDILEDDGFYGPERKLEPDPEPEDDFFEENDQF